MPSNSWCEVDAPWKGIFKTGFIRSQSDKCTQRLGDANHSVVTEDRDLFEKCFTDPNGNTYMGVSACTHTHAHTCTPTV